MQTVLALVVCVVLAAALCVVAAWVGAAVYRLIHEQGRYAIQDPRHLRPWRAARGERVR